MTQDITVVIMHSMRSTPEEYEAIFQPWVEDLPVNLVLPNGEPFEAGGFTWFPREYYGDPVAQVMHLVTAADRLADRLRGHGRVIVTGASQGGDLAFALAVRHPQLVLAALPMLALYPAGVWPATGDGIAPIHAFHGESDPIVSVDTARRAAAGLAERGLPLTLHTFPDVGHDLPEQMLAEWRAALIANLPES